VGVPPGQRFAGGDCTSCIKPPLERENLQDAYNQYHPFSGWIGGLLGKFLGSDLDDTLDHSGDALGKLGEQVKTCHTQHQARLETP
jgi:hypothetical protein